MNGLVLVKRLVCAKKLVWALAFAMASSGVAAAGKGIALQPIRDQQAQIRDGVLARSGIYKDMSDDSRMQLLHRQSRLLALLDGKQNAIELTPDQRVEAFNILEWIEGTLNQTSDKRMVCERGRRTGTNRIESVCRTEKQIREARERARRQVQGDFPLGI